MRLSAPIDEAATFTDSDRLSAMPELPEAEVIRRQLCARILGRTILEIRLNREDIVRTGLPTRSWYRHATILDIHRTGKSLVLTCGKESEQRYLIVELGMTGLIFFHSAAQDIRTHVHLTIAMEDDHNPCLHYWNPRRFGGVHLMTAEEWTSWSHRRFGSDPFAIPRKEFHRLVRASRSRIKTLLLDQRKLAGLGNIYANEILFHAGIHPHAQGRRLSSTTIDRLFAAMQTILREAIACQGSTIRDFRAPDGSCGRFQERHAVYQKTGAPCPRGCGGSIRRLVTERSSFYCPVCQTRR